MNEILDDLAHNNPEVPKERHGCVTAWLVLMIIGSGLSAFAYLFQGDAISAVLPSSPSKMLLSGLAIMGLLNVAFAVMMLQWKKMGFYGFAASACIVFVINLSIGIGFVQSIFGLAGVAILYAILQIPAKNGNSAWKGLE